ncbi:MAG: hypothetical protein ACREPR_18050 [Brasilonema sp.]
MTTTSNNDPTIADVIKRLDKLSTDVEQFSAADVIKRLDKLSTDVEQFSAEAKKFDERFADYRQATQWVVQLAFTLIASATITVIITSVLRK